MGRRIKVGNGTTNTSIDEQHERTETGDTNERSDIKNGKTGERGNGEGRGNTSTTTTTTTTKSESRTEEGKQANELSKSIVLSQGNPKKVSLTLPDTGEKIEPTKKKRTRKNTKNKDADATDIIKFLNAINAIIPAQSAVGVLKLSEKEIENIAQPLANILDKNGIGEKIAEKSDGIALVTAVTMAYAPRAFFVFNTLQQKKKQEEFKNGIGKTTDNAKQRGEIQKTSDSDAVTNENAVRVRTNGNELFDILPPTIG